MGGQPLRFIYEATDIITRFTDYADEKARSREVFSFHRPETLRELLANDSTIRNRMKAVPFFEDTQNRFRDCQTKAIRGLERSFSENRPRAPIQMATGAGKTYTAITTVYRLLQNVKVKRVLFLVDTKNLGSQAETGFIGYMQNDETRLFSELYDVRRLKSQIRTVIRTFKEKLLTEIFPGRREVPKTIIFAKSDSHADDIIQIARDEFGESNDFCRKITYNADKPETVLSEFRNGYYPRIAVTVDMIATGTDVKPVECLLFMRDVRSRNYFEQMKGRGTRTLEADDLQKVTPSATGNKARFVIVDAIGVTQSLKTESRSLERKPGVSLEDLMVKVVK